MRLLTKSNGAEYLRIMKSIAETAGYDPDELTLAKDGIHKLDLSGIKFGNIQYPDFILFLMNGEIDEAKKHRQNFLTRTANMKGNWKKDKYSRNNLARRIIWFADEKK